jgi:hypothetical protein
MRCSANLKLWITILLPWILIFGIKAQPTILKGQLRPEYPMPHTWFLDTVRHQMARFNGVLWQTTDQATQISDMIPCGELVILQATYSGRPYKAILDTSSIFSNLTSRYYCGESILWTEYAQKHEILFTGPRFDANQPIRLTMSVHAACDTFHVDTLNGVLAFCMPDYVPSMYGRCEDYHNWGMLSTNAHWLIEPKFDAPFHFKNGIAEVLYYGQKRKINEQGEFVE